MQAQSGDIAGPEAPAAARAQAIASSDSLGPDERVLGIDDSALGYMSLEDTLSELLERIREAVGVDTAAILLLDEDRGVLVARAARGLEEEVRQGVQVPLARGFAGRIAAERRPIIIEDLDRADVVNPILRQRGIRSMLGVPLNIGERVIGVMHIGTLVSRDFDQGDVALLQLAADRAASAIDQARIAEQRSVTAIMQRTLLPDELPQIPGLQFSAKYLPAGSGIKIGGDWYDVFQLHNGHVAFVIGDVVGRGVLAASVMMEIRTALRAYMTQGHRLTAVVSALNDLIVSMGRNRSATLVIAELDPQAEVLEVVTAGHLPPLLMDPDGSSRFLEHRPGLPIGVQSSQRYESFRYAFPAGSRLLLYTDGLVERRDEAIDAGLARLEAAAHFAAEHSDATFADRVYRRMLKAAELNDDLALLATEMLPLQCSLDMTLQARPDVLGGLRNTVGRWLRTAGADENELFDLTLSTSEAATNAIEHAYGAREASFTVSCKRDGPEVTITVTDSGRWRTGSPPGGGRGLGIMRALLDSVSVESGDGGTVVTMTKTLASA